MFGKKTANGYSEEKDLQLLMQAMDGVIGGNYEDIDTSAFQNPAYGEKFNELIHAYKRSNNNFVMRLNQAMGSIGDNSYVKKTLDQVQSQTESIRDMQAVTWKHLLTIFRKQCHISVRIHMMSLQPLTVVRKI